MTTTTKYTMEKVMIVCLGEQLQERVGTDRGHAHQPTGKHKD